uniref:C2 domain-containing protein n=2 Tax=Amphiprion ocellaris TaxID=80972 RepID=A0AAQ5XYP9_AMPOC
MGSIRSGANRGEDMVTFCTYSLLDFEVHSTPLVSGTQPHYGFTSRYALTPRDLGRLGGQGSRVRVELHQALGGVRFVTHGSGQMSVMGAMERRGERIGGRVNITGQEGEFVGAVDFWVRLFPPAEPMDTVEESGAERKTATQKSPLQTCLGWQDSSHEELHDYGGGIPNELVVMLERCVGLNARWPGLLPDAYLTYRFYDLPPHVSRTVQCTTDPVFNDAISFPLAVTADVLHYLRSSSLWVYVFDASDEQIPPAYLAKTPVPLRALATGREIRGDYVLRDPAGGPRGTVRVMMKWKYPFQPQVDGLSGEVGKGRAMESTEKEADSSQKPIAKPRVKTQQPEPRETKAVQKEIKSWPRPPSVKQKSSQDLRPEKITLVKPPSTDRKRSTKRSPELHQRTPHLTPEPRLTTPSYLPTTRSSEGTSSRQSPTTPSRRSSASDARTQEFPSVDQVSVVEEGEEEEKSGSAAAGDSDAPESSRSSSSQSDIIVISPKRKMRKGDKLRVEILSLTFEPSSHVAMDESVQRVYVEYRLLGVPMETTETPMSLRKPTTGEEIHYNFTRVIYVDGSQSAPLRQYLYTMLEGTDPNQGRLKFTVVSEPMDDEEECVDVGHAFLDLKELLLTGNDVIEQQIDILSLDEDKEVIGNLKVSLEAAKVLTGIYQEFHQKDKKEEKTDEDESQEEEEEKKKDQIQMIDYDDDSDFY